MAHSISISDELYKITVKEARRNSRSVPKQIEYWAKVATAAKIAQLNNATIDDTLDLLESSERAALGEGVAIEDIDDYFRKLS
jgi:hypothetical protein